MADDQRVYSDEEFAIILRKATELASEVPPTATSDGGLTLGEMKSAAAQAGFDPALVERAARMLVANVAASPVEKLIGGPWRQEDTDHFPVMLDERKAALLLSAIRINAGLAGSRDDGHSGSMGMSWRDGGEMSSLRVTARPDEDGTAVSVTLDRRATLGALAVSSGLVMFFGLLFAGSALYPEAPVQGYAGAIAAIVGPLAIARGYWAASTRKARERIGKVMEVIGQTLAQQETSSQSSRSLSEGATGQAPDSDEAE